MEKITPEQRSNNMRRIKSKNTQPELAVRRWLHSQGFRFRLHCSDLPGKPDIVLPKYKSVIFVHGCFWHHHPGCKRAVLPKSRKNYWLPKLEKNKERFERDKKLLMEKGWNVIVIWECETKSTDLLALAERLKLGKERENL